MTLDELREQEQQARARLGVGCENPAEWEIEGLDSLGMISAIHSLDGIDLDLAADGLSISLEPPGYSKGKERHSFVPAETLVKMFTELRAAIGPTAFEEIYGGIDGNH